MRTLGPGLIALLAACAGPADEVVDGPFRVVVDAHGVPHVTASTDHDAFFLQGWLAARDRLFQMDLTRRRALGRRAELLGEDRYLSDLQARALGFGRWGARSAAWIEQHDPASFAMFTAYADGVNRYLADAAAGRNGASLPPQVEALGYTPEPWTVADSLAIEKMITAGLSMRPDQEVTLGMLWLLLGRDGFEDLYRYAPFDRDYIAPAAEVASQPRSGRPRDPALAALADALQGVRLDGLSRSLRALDLAGGGSNNWAVAPQLTAGGHVVLAGDSHQGVAHPSTYWLVHLTSEDPSGGFDVVGANFPGVPLVMFGHNGHVAWTPTTSLLDVADAWLETWAVEGASVRFRDADVAVIVHDETIEVRLEDGTLDARRHALHEVPHHGPILPAEALDLPLPLTISIGWTGFRPESIAPTYLGFARARSFDDVRAALTGYHAGGMNWVYGDVEGHLGWTDRVDVPVREVLDPETPPWTLLPGTGGYEWLPGEDGAPYASLPDDDLPFLLDPPSGVVATANNDPTGATDDDDPLDDPRYLSAIFDIGTRSFQPKRRIAALTAGGPATFEQLRDVQLDTTSRLAEVLLPYLADAARRRPDLVDEASADLLARLSAWDATCGVDAVEPTIFHLWLALAAKGMLADEPAGLAGSVGDLVFDDMSYQLGLVAVKFLKHWLEATADDLDAIERGDLPFPSATGRNLFDVVGTPAVETRDEVLLGALAAVPAQAARIFADRAAPLDPDGWRWGDWHQLVLHDGAEALVPEASAPPVGKAGGLYTVDVGDFSWFVDGEIPTRLEITNAPSNRFAFELAPGAVRFDLALPGGQSERPGDAHHNDLLPDYLAGRYRTLDADPEGEALELEFR